MARKKQQVETPTTREAEGPVLVVGHALYPAWEHHVEWVPLVDERETIQKLGQEGWELVCLREERRQARKGDPIRGEVVYLTGVVLYMKRLAPTRR